MKKIITLMLCLVFIVSVLPINAKAASITNYYITVSSNKVIGSTFFADRVSIEKKKRYEYRFEYVTKARYQKAKKQLLKKYVVKSYGVITPKKPYSEETSVTANKERSFVAIAVIDTGIIAADPIFDGRLAFFDKQLEKIVPVNDISQVSTNSDFVDTNGHGTAMSGAICSVTSEDVRIVPIRTHDENGDADPDVFNDAIRRAIDYGVDIINISAGGFGENMTTKALIDEAYEKGIPVVCAAGNESVNVEVKYPANIVKAFSVSATDEYGTIADYSNVGSLIDFAAYGKFSYMGYTFTGTSVATAYVSGFAANSLIKIKNNNTNANGALLTETIYNYLFTNAYDAGDVGFDDLYGNGILFEEVFRSVRLVA